MNPRVQRQARHPRGSGQQAFVALGRVLAARSQGQATTAAQDWMDPAVVHAVQLELPGSPGAAPRLAVAVAEGIPLRALPTHPWGPDGPSLQAIRAPRAVAQGAPSMAALSNPGVRGTATALVSDALSPRQYVLTCGHVAAGLPGAAVNDRVDILVGGVPLRGCLVDWQPSLGVGVMRTGLDAALVEVSAADALTLRQLRDWMPTGVNPHPVADLPITLRRSSQPLAGRLKVYWSGLVDVPGYTPGVADYFLEGGIGYETAGLTAGGDSGGGVWDDQERLMGMHVGALPAARTGDANAVYAPVQPVLDWYSVRLQTRGGAGHPQPVPVESPPRAAPAVAPPPVGGGAAFPASEREVLACTLWGEARNQGKAGMLAVASVIENRRRRGYRNKHSVVEVCLDPWQFSCWNRGDPNLGRMRAVALAPDGPYRDALAIADEVLLHSVEDTVRKARHYYAVTLPKPPYWARGKTPCAVVGDHLFFNDID